MPDLAAPPAVERAAAVLSRRALTVVAISAVAAELRLTEDDLAMLLRRLSDGGAALPRVMRDLVAADPVAPLAAPSTLAGTEVLDLSALSLADIGLVAEPVVSLPRPERTEIHSPAPAVADSAATTDDPDDDDDSDPEPISAYWRYVGEAGRYTLLSAVEEVELARMIEAGVLARERLDGATGADTALLRLLVAAGEAAFTRFVTANLRLVVAVARDYGDPTLDPLDLVQEGNLGLIRAVQKFDFTQGTKFSTYATWWVRQAITRAIADKSRTIRYPVHVVERLNSLTRRNLPADDPEAAELRDSLPTTVPLDVTLDAFGEDGFQHAAERYQRTTEPDLRGLTVEDVAEALEGLTPRERHVLHRRFGFAGDPATLDAVGVEFGVTRERIRQIQGKAIAAVERRLRPTHDAQAANPS